MEYLMTYGWAILIMAVVISILYTLGVFNPREAAPVSCTLPAGFSCYAYRLTTNATLYLDLGQATGRTVRVTGLACSKANSPHINQTVNITIRSGAHKVVTSNITLKCLEIDDATPTTATDYYRGKIVINYTEIDTGITHKLVGDIAARFEQE